jgi:hypothetical protein
MLAALQEGVKGWPNAYFTDLGLFSLARALASVRQSARR